ncbi:MAG: ABC transporter ATP-binding protein [Acidobacteriota bacterium]
MTEAASAENALELRGVTVRYGKAVAAKGVSLSVPAGEVTALLGRNGAGKTSLIRVLLGMRKAQEGEALLWGKDAWKHRHELLERVGVVPETPDAPEDLSVRDLLAFCSRLYRTWDGKGAEDRLERFGVPLGVPFGSLSKGQKGHAMLALALAHRPDLLVLDDPTLGLDAVARKAFFEELVADLADRGAAVFLSSHDLSGVESIADRVAFLREGRLLLDEPLEGLKARFRRLSFRREKEAGEAALRPLEPVFVRRTAFGEESVVAAYEETAFHGFASSPGVAAAEASEMSLEEIFIALTGEEGGAP